MEAASDLTGPCTGRDQTHAEVFCFAPSAAVADRLLSQLQAGGYTLQAVKQGQDTVEGLAAAGGSPAPVGASSASAQGKAKSCCSSKAKASSNNSESASGKSPAKAGCSCGPAAAAPAAPRPAAKPAPSGCSTCGPAASGVAQLPCAPQRRPPPPPPQPPQQQQNAPLPAASAAPCSPVGGPKAAAAAAPSPEEQAQALRSLTFGTFAAWAPAYYEARLGSGVPGPWAQASSVPRDLTFGVELEVMVGQRGVTFARMMRRLREAGCRSDWRCGFHAASIMSGILGIMHEGRVFGSETAWAGAKGGGTVVGGQLSTWLLPCMQNTSPHACGGFEGCMLVQYPLKHVLPCMYARSVVEDGTIDIPDTTGGLPMELVSGVLHGPQGLMEVGGWELGGMPSACSRAAMAVCGQTSSRKPFLYYATTATSVTDLAAELHTCANPCRCTGLALPCAAWAQPWKSTTAQACTCTWASTNPGLLRHQPHLERGSR